MKKTIFLSIVILFTLGLFAQAPQSINYQAVARDGAGSVLDARQGTVRVSILDAVGGTVLYQEEHTVTTNQFGLFTLAIGNGTPLQGDFSMINWGGGDRFLQVEVDFGSGYEDMGTTQLLSVPYALYAETSGDGPPGKNSLMSIVQATAVTCPNGGYQISVGTDADGNNTLDANEITGSFTVCNGADGSSTLVAGDGIDIDYLTNTLTNTGDLDSTNELITNAYLQGTDLYIIEDGAQWIVDLSSLVSGMDTSNTNEIQTLSINGNTITLSNGGGNFTLSSNSPTNGDVLTWNGSSWVAQAFVGDNWGSQVVQTSGTNISGDGTPANPLTVTDNDSDPANEYNTGFSIVGANLSLTDGGGTFTVPLSALSDDDWLTNGTHIYNGNTGNVGIGTISPTSKLNVYDNSTTGTTVGKFHVGISGGTGNTYALYAKNEGNFTNNYGVYTTLTGGSAQTNYGIYSSVTAGTTRWAGYFANGNVFINDNVGIGTTTPTAPLEIQTVSGNTIKFSGTNEASMYHPNNGFQLKADYLSFISSTGGSITFFTNNNISNARMLISPSGNVGIGTNSPSAKLHVVAADTTAGIMLENASSSNKWDFRMISPTTLRLYYNGTQVGWWNALTGAYTATSDKRLKENIEPISNVLEGVIQLKPVKYHFTRNNNDEYVKKTWGFIAQDVKKIFPELVEGGDEENKFYGINYDNFGILAIKAIQEQQQIIEQLQQEMENLKQEIKKLKK